MVLLIFWILTDCQNFHAVFYSLEITHYKQNQILTYLSTTFFYVMNQSLQFINLNFLTLFTSSTLPQTPLRRASSPRH